MTSSRPSGSQAMLNGSVCGWETSHHLWFPRNHTGVITLGASPPAAALAPRTLPGPYPSNQQLLVFVELDVFDNRLLDPEQGRP